jgi:hypothetical protein
MASQAASHRGQREPLKRSFLIPVLTVWLHEKCARLNKFTVLWDVGSLQLSARTGDVTSLKTVRVILMLIAVRT